MYRKLLQKLTVVPWNTERHSVRGDTIIAIAIPVACIGVLLDAYYRTEYHDADTSLDAQFIPSNDCIESYSCIAPAAGIPSPTTSTETISLRNLNKNGNSNSIVQTLERDGIVIIPNAITPAILSAVRDNILSLQQPHEMTSARDDSTNNTKSRDQPYVFATSSNDTDVRQDKIIWLRNGRTAGICNNPLPGTTGSTAVEDSTKSSIGQDLEYCINFIRGIPYALEKNGYTLSNDHRIPKQCQLSMYIGDNISSYRRHLDTCTSTIYDLGLLEYLRLSDYRQRRITIILYLNESQRPIQHGGTLRCWVSNELSQGHPPLAPDSLQNDIRTLTEHKTIFHPPFDVQPTGGTLVIFQSQRYED
jgi:2OG-Fe(II) oxygenase superfamily